MSEVKPRCLRQRATARSRDISTQVTNERPMVPVVVTVTDVSGQEDRFTLDAHGFQYVRHASAHAHSIVDNDSGQAIRNGYYRECEQLLKDV